MKKKIIAILILMLAFIAMGFSGCTKPITYNIIGKEKVYGYTYRMIGDKMIDNWIPLCSFTLSDGENTIKVYVTEYEYDKYEVGDNYTV